MSWRLSRALVSLQAEVNADEPERSKASDGTKGDDAHAARVSDHNPDAAGIVHAWDCTVWDDEDPDELDDVAGPLAEFLRASRDPRIKYVIHRGRMFSSYATATRKAWEWGPYTGANGHFHHVHVSVYGDDPAPWGYPATTQPPKDWYDMATEADLTRIIDARLDAKLAPIKADVAAIHAETVTSTPATKTRKGSMRWLVGKIAKGEVVA